MKWEMLFGNSQFLKPYNRVTMQKKKGKWQLIVNKAQSLSFPQTTSFAACLCSPSPQEVYFSNTWNSACPMTCLGQYNTTDKWCAYLQTDAQEALHASTWSWNSTITRKITVHPPPPKLARKWRDHVVLLDYSASNLPTSEPQMHEQAFIKLSEPT